MPVTVLSAHGKILLMAVLYQRMRSPNPLQSPQPRPLQSLPQSASMYNEAQGCKGLLFHRS